MPKKKDIKTEELRQQIMANPLVQERLKAVTEASEVQSVLSPLQVRALVVDQLMRHALDEDISPATRLKALQMLGKVTEVGAFTERRKVEHVKDAGVVKDELISALKAALNERASKSGEQGHRDRGRPMTPRQEQLYRAIQDYWKTNHHGPSVSDLQRIMGVKSRSWVHDTMIKLVNRGYCVYLKNQTRSIKPIHG